MPQIVLIGPIGAGKTTVAELLSERLGLRNVPLDLIRWGYYFAIGFDLMEERRRVRDHGDMARYEYWKPFEVHAVECAVRDYPDAILDFGGGHSVQPDPALFARVAAALAPVRHVILLLPAPDPARSLAYLMAREHGRPRPGDTMSDLTAAMLADPSNARLATATVYTEGRTPEEVCDAVIATIGG